MSLATLPEKMQVLSVQNAHGLGEVTEDVVGEVLFGDEVVENDQLRGFLQALAGYWLDPRFA